MTTTLPFEKWEGLGNDFVVLSSPVLNAEVVRELCDRHRGIGADGILFVEETGDHAKMIVLNADGSRPEMCGNGLRCVAAFLAEKRGLEEAEFVVATDAGDKRCAVKRNDDGLYDVTVDMGYAKQGLEYVVAAGGKQIRFTTIDVGNPHAISFAPFTQEDVDQIGPIAATGKQGGTNVEFCRVLEGQEQQNTKIEVVVWERGVGRTLACGTGACAVAAAACEAGMAAFGEPMKIVLPGGPLEITVDERRALRMKGPARRVFRGTLAPRSLEGTFPC